MSGVRFDICRWNWSELGMLAGAFAAGEEALEDPLSLFLMMKTTAAAMTSATPTQKMIRLVRCEDRED
jgi:hypothetical protein